jgi:hypothetical protein
VLEANGASALERARTLCELGAAQRRAGQLAVSSRDELRAATGRRRRVARRARRSGIPQQPRLDLKKPDLAEGVWLTCTSPLGHKISSLTVTMRMMTELSQMSVDQHGALHTEPRCRELS